MDISPTTSNVKVSNHIPDDLVNSILHKLPIKSLKRFGCVRKSWSLLFMDPDFMTVYSNCFLSKNHSFYDDTSLLLHLKTRDKYDLYSLSGERFENIVKLDWPKVPLQVPVRRGRIIHRIGGIPKENVPPSQVSDFSFEIPSSKKSCEILGPIGINGTLCLEYPEIPDIRGNTKLILWNPTIEESKVIYLHNSNHLSIRWGRNYQVGYDRAKNDYKMIRRTLYPPKVHPYSSLQVNFFWEIYSLNSNSWRKINDNVPHSDRCLEVVYMDGVSHWLNTSRTETYLVSFDFSKESFITTPIPSYEGDCFDFYSIGRLLTILNGSIAFIVNYKERATFHISILSELGVKESWTRLFAVGPLPCLEYPIGAGKKGNILIRKKDNNLAWFDLSTGMIDEIGIRDEFGCKILFHKESFLPIGGIYNNFSSCFHGP
ncbi:hypothetical protein TSUD_14810 [Trifolium subterraneum]|uniref:F-box associated beta-propeller type 1 domain-containing protein n=1 Tax=Trifolium subterraneum TaxID=3900 RepID=A0A2Z6M612_TRISU|nr:hypothetical protein TSUD_14810 [Trifolium subterraneum]